MMRHPNFVAFILTHGRPDRVLTFGILRKHGYTGRIVLVVDDEDASRAEYQARYGEQVVIFSKAEAAQYTDGGDNFGKRRGVVYARNACWKIAAALGVEHFVVLDDDYTDFRYKFDETGKYHYKVAVHDLDGVFDLFLDYLIHARLDSIAFSQGGDWFGNEVDYQNDAWKMKRKLMNSFFCATARPFDFFGRINEDVSAYCVHGSRGKIFFTVMQVALQQVATQQNPEGLTTLYLDLGTYVKSFYSVMYQPSSVKVTEMHSKFKRLHHRVTWGDTVPCILRAHHKKPAPVTEDS